MKRRTLLLGTATLPATGWLSGCGGGTEVIAARVRLVNASPGYAALDLYVRNDKSASAVAFGGASAFVSLDAGTYQTALRNAGSGASLLTVDRSFQQEKSYSLVAHGWAGSLRAALLTEDEAAPRAGVGKLRVFNTAADAGSIDVYVGEPSASIAQMALLAAAVAGDATSSFSELDAGTYRIVVTAAGDAADVRLDIASIDFASRQVATLVVVPTRGGVLVSALRVTQGGSVTAYANTQARVRVVAAVAGNGTVSVVAGSTTLTGGSKAPTVGAYSLIDAATQPLTVRVDGLAVPADPLDAEPGGDYTLLVHGEATAPAVGVLVDDNRRPTASANFKIRLVHAVAALGSNLTLEIDFTAVANDVVYPTASSPSTLAATTASQLLVTSPLSSVALYTLSDVALQAQAVYTLFMLGSATALSGVLRKDR